MYQRYSDYANFLTLKGLALAKMGKISTIGGDEDAFGVFDFALNWMGRNSKYLGETSTAEVNCRYLYARTFVENGNKDREKSLEFDNILNALKRKTNPTNFLAHEIYLSYLKELLESESRARYQNRFP